MSEPRIIARVSAADGYDGLIEAVRARITELGISYATVDQLAGWTETYASKLLAPAPPSGIRSSRHGRLLSHRSFGEIMGATGLMIWVVEDEAATERIKRHRDFVPANSAQKRPRWTRVPMMTRPVWLFTGENARKMGSKGGNNSLPKRSLRTRKKLSKMANKIRWEKVKAGLSTICQHCGKAVFAPHGVALRCPCGGP